MDMNKLTITVDRDDYSIGLTGHLLVNGFSGFGKGWFNDRDVSSFCTRIQSIANNMKGTAELGAGSKSDSSECQQTFALNCYVLCDSKLNGIIGVHVTLSECPYTGCREQEILKVSGELQVRNQHLAVFSQELKKLMQGSINQVTLASDLNII